MPNVAQPIDATLNYQPGGNPLLGLAGGIGGLAQQYGQDYNSYLSANQTNYNNIIKGYGTVMQNVTNSLGQGGTGYGAAQPAADDINSAARQASGGAISRSISSGTGKSTAAAALQTGVLNTQSHALKSLGLGLANEYAGYESQIGQNELGFMNSVNAPPPNAAAYGQLAQQYGQTQQQAANMAMQQQALDQQRRSASLAASRGMSGGGGVTIPSAPRGGTFGSGGGGFPSGGGVAPTSGGAPAGLTPPGTTPANLGNGIVYPGGVPSFDPWAGGQEDTAAGYGLGGGGNDMIAGQSPVTKPGDWGLSNSGFSWG